MRTCPECQNHYDDEILHCPEDGFNLAGVEPVDEMIGRAIGSYKITKPLGKGGMGAVYRADHPVIGSKVAIKFLHAQYANDAKIVDRFFNEARAVNLIGHDNVLKIVDLNITDDNRHYFIMEFLQGKALQAIVKPNQPVPLEITGQILMQCCAALQAAHDKGIIHRDLKPDNIYLIVHNGRKNFVKIVDFGIAKLTEGGVSTGKTQTGMVMGTPAYMSPEQGSGETSKIDGRSDVYSLGVMMFQMATGRLPFPGSNFGEVLMGHLQKTPPPPRSIVPEIPEDYEQIILKTLEKSQDDRFQSMAELREAIFNVLQTHGISAELPLADETEELQPVDGGSPSNPGARTPSRPGRTNPPRTGQGQGLRTSQPPRNPSNPNASGRRPSQAPRVPTGAPRQAEEPKSKLPLILGAVFGVIALIGVGVGLAVKSSNEKDAADRKAVVEKAEKAKAAARAAEEAAQPILLLVASDPAGAVVDASWGDGATKSGTTPFELEVPKGTKVRLEFKKDGYNGMEKDVIADKAQAVNASLKPVAKAMAAATPPAEGERPDPAAKKGKKGKKDDVKAPAQTDGLIDISDAFGK